MTVKVAEIPAPEEDCPTKDDVAKLARMMPVFFEPSEQADLEALSFRFIDAAAYCNMAAKRLR